MTNRLYPQVTQIVQWEQQKTFASDCIADKQIGYLSQVTKLIMTT